MTKEYSIVSLSDWDVLVQELLPGLKAGTILALSGPLGAGKTTFVQALARALRIKEIPVSPTFSLVRTYLVKGHTLIKRMVHVDAYRIERAEDVMTLGLDELLEESGTMMCLEWPEQVDTWLQRYKARVIRVKIQVCEHDRRVEIS
jgi:tRNA threonylcarbamoyladenosine biosynthesis protein TsaE